MTDQATARPGSGATPAPLAFEAPTGSPFAMDVEDLFGFADGRTVFVGQVPSGDPEFITPQRARRCDLVVDERVVQTITLDGEMMPRVATPGTPPRRAVYTREAVRVDAAAVRASRCRLVDHPA